MPKEELPKINQENSTQPNKENLPEEKLYQSILEGIRPKDNTLPMGGTYYQKIIELVYGGGEHKDKEEFVGIIMKRARARGYSVEKLAENLTILKYPDFRKKE